MSTRNNLLLESLPDEIKSVLMRRLGTVDLPGRTVLFDTEETPRYVHFLTSGIASTLTMMEGGEAVEVGLTGREAFPEKLHVIGPQVSSMQCIMQIAGSALRMSFREFKAELLRHP